MNNGIERTFLLSDLIGLKALLGKKRIGKLADVVISDAVKAPEVTHLLISRPYGDKPLMVPWAKVGELGERTVDLLIEQPAATRASRPRSGSAQGSSARQESAGLQRRRG